MSMRRLTTKQFIERAKAIHGDKFDYSQVKYVNARHGKIKISCPKHGPFEQAPFDHLTSGGCFKCGVEKRTRAITLTADEFVSRAMEVHGERYDYSKVVYAGDGEKVVIVCRQHGDFMQSPSNHKKGHGCAECASINRARSRVKRAEIRFMAESKRAHGDTYDYSRVVYKKAKSKVEVICHTHGSFFIAPGHHRIGKGCPACGTDRRSELRRYTTDQFVLAGNRVHGSLYSYTKTDYKGSKEKVLITCGRHGEFSQAPSDHLSGYGCPMCAVNGELVCSLYILKSNSKVKVGIARDVQRRARVLKRKTPFDFHLHSSVEVKNMHAARALEREVHNTLRGVSSKLSGFDGATEWFSVDADHAIRVVESLIGGVSYAKSSRKQLSLF